jgi:phage terminase large subunit-like protein
MGNLELMPATTPKPRKKQPLPVDTGQAARVGRYARDVISGKILAGKYVRLACERHLRDLETGKARGLVWMPQRAEAALEFCEGVLFLDKDVPLKLDEFQAFIVGSLFGWYGDDGFRRFHTGYLEIAKGNGKTPIGAACGLYGLLIDKEPAPEVYTAAVSQDQANICFKDASRMVESSPELARRVLVQMASLTVPSRYGVMRALSAEHKNLDGKRVHIGIVDELHEHPNDLVVDKLAAGTKQRRNALILELTNSGHDRTSVCWRHRETSINILEGRGENDSWFAYICGLDPCAQCAAEGKAQPDPKCPRCDDWRDPKVWIKANPGLGTILPISYLKKQVGDAASMNSKENIVRRLNFCQWTETANRWLNMVKWDECGRTPLNLAALRGQPCKLAIDAASVGDFCALVFEFNLDGKFQLLPFFFLPEDNLRERINKTGLRMDLWVKDGFLTLTPGNQVDYDFLRVFINQKREEYQIDEIAFDPWNISQLVTQLQGDGFTVVPVRQGFATLSPPTKEFEKAMLAGKLQHGNHPILRWMAGNAATEEDATGNIKPSKTKSAEKIDGIVASVMAHDRWIRQNPEPEGDCGMLVLG